MESHENPGFEPEDRSTCNERTKNDEPQNAVTMEKGTSKTEAESEAPQRDLWGNDLEFLMSCIAMSVGLGNVWRFPFTALENGGGAFLIPYLIVLFLVGRPIYFLEMIIGQFSSRGPSKVYDLCPAMRGVGIGQVFSISMVTTYYVSIMAITLKYILDSVYPILPWSYCREEWNENCIPSGYNMNSTVVINSTANPTASAELYFLNEILREKDNINDGIGWPNWELVIGLFISWVCIFGVISRGVRSSGKASYFLALFPYVIMLVLLVRAVTLPGALDGIIYFIKPQWGEILNPNVWYAAVTQVFYSLSVCFGNIIMYSSFNRFSHNVHRDASIVTYLDTFTSLLSGFTIFGILGHLAHEIGTDDIGSVVKGGTGLAFISYPDAIAKFKAFPQVFSILFFVMLFILGVGSNIAMTSCSVTAVRDHFPKVKQWQGALVLAIISFIIGLMYITPGGQFMLNLIDYFGASMIALALGIFELWILGWVYGVRRLCKDTEMMFGMNPGLYWRLCWGVITPTIMTVILIYTFVTYEPLTYKDVNYPDWATAVGWTIAAVGIAQAPIWLIIAVIRQPGDSLKEKFAGAFRPKADWGPSDPLLREKYHKEIAIRNSIIEKPGVWAAIKRNLFD